jgi:hypothetical protein
MNAVPDAVVELDVLVVAPEGQVAGGAVFFPPRVKALAL